MANEHVQVENAQKVKPEKKYIIVHATGEQVEQVMYTTGLEQTFMEYMKLKTTGAKAMVFQEVELKLNVA